MKDLLIAFFLASALSVPAFAHEGGEGKMEIGPDKGVTEVAKDKSFRLSPEAAKNFGLKTVPYAPGPLALPKTAIVHTLRESQIYRLRDGYLKPVDFEAVAKAEGSWTVRSNDLRPKDEIVVNGVGFLRIISAQLGEAKDDHGENEHAHGAGKESHHD